MDGVDVLHGAVATCGECFFKSLGGSDVASSGRCGEQKDAWFSDHLWPSRRALRLVWEVSWLALKRQVSPGVGASQDSFRASPACSGRLGVTQTRLKQAVRTALTRASCCQMRAFPGCLGRFFVLR